MILSLCYRVERTSENIVSMPVQSTLCLDWLNCHITRLLIGPNHAFRILNIRVHICQNKNLCYDLEHLKTINCISYIVLKKFIDFLRMWEIAWFIFRTVAQKGEPKIKCLRSFMYTLFSDFGAVKWTIKISWCECDKLYKILLNWKSNWFDDWAK